MNREFTFFSWSVQGQVNPIPVEKAEGIYFWDTDGKRYMDFSSQLMNTNIGHQHPKVVKAIQEQQETITALKARVTSLEQTIEQLSPPQAANAAITVIDAPGWLTLAILAFFFAVVAPAPKPFRPLPPPPPIPR